MIRYDKEEERKRLYIPNMNGVRSEARLAKEEVVVLLERQRALYLAEVRVTCNIKDKELDGDGVEGAVVIIKCLEVGFPNFFQLLVNI